MRLFLASESPRRRELLSRITADFVVERADVEELSAAGELTPEEVVQCNAARKAEYVSSRHHDSWVLGADTVVVLDGQIYGKPRDLAEATEFLRKFSGREHRVLTAMSLRWRDGSVAADKLVSSQVRFRPLSDAVIAEYLSRVEVLDKAGAYGIQEHGDMLVESISGELENIIGLPIKVLQDWMTGLGIL